MMVRLIVVVVNKRNDVLVKFQFHDGAIDRMLPGLSFCSFKRVSIP